MEELLKDEKSQEILKEFIHQYIVENLRVHTTQYQGGVTEIDLYLGADFIQTAQL